MPVMHSGMAWTAWLADEAATEAAGASMARHLPPPGRPFVLHLHGDLGTGKTTLTRGVLRALGEQGVVRSPTYGLISEYSTSAGRIIHLDLYRLRSPFELAGLGLDDYLSGSRLWLIEWPEKAEGARLPQADARIFLDVESSGRRIGVVSCSGAAREWAKGFNPDPGS